MKQELEAAYKALDKVKAIYEESIKPKLPELNKWYKDKTNKAIYVFTEHNGLNGYCNTYGFDFEGEWMEPNPKRRLTKETINVLEEATESEVLEALTNEAKKRFFVDGSKIEYNNKICTLGTSSHPVLLDKSGKFFIPKIKNFEFWAYADWSNVPILKNGQWATPIPKEKTLEDHAIDFVKLYNHIGCTKKTCFIKYFNDNNLKITKI